MLIVGALLFLAVSIMHSLLGGQRLIAPICVLKDLPAILGSRRDTELTLTIGWHLLSVFWVYLAGLLLSIHFAVSAFQSILVESLGVLSILCGVMALVMSRGKHLSSVIFVPLGLILLAVQGPG